MQTTLPSSKPCCVRGGRAPRVQGLFRVSCRAARRAPRAAAAITSLRGYSAEAVGGALCAIDKAHDVAAVATRDVAAVGLEL